MRMELSMTDRKAVEQLKNIKEEACRPQARLFVEIGIVA
jgi:hypothetical protein